MNMIDQVKLIAKTFADEINARGWRGTKEFAIQQSNGDICVVRLNSNNHYIQVLFRDVPLTAFVLFQNGAVTAANRLESFGGMFSNLADYALKIIQAILDSMPASSHSSQQSRLFDQPKKHRNGNKKSKIDKINALLDRYNDTALLYKMFRNKKYAKRKKRIMFILQQISVKT